MMSSARRASWTWLRSNVERAERQLATVSAWKIFLLALLLRVIVVALQLVHWNITENLAAGFTWATRGYLGDPFPWPTGPTAHVAPGYPAIIAIARLLSPDESSAVILLQAVAAVVSAANVALLIPLASSLRLGRSVGVVCAILWLVPAFTWIELSAQFETIWVVSAVLLLLMLTISRFLSARLGPIDGALIGASAGVAAHFSPLVLPMLALTCLTGVVSVRLSIRKTLVLGASIVAAFLVVVTPYTIRNLKTFDSLFLIRSNFGLELAVSNSDGATPIADANNLPDGSLKHHPFNSALEAARIRDLGEARYFHRRQSEAFEWISQHPRQFLDLTAGRAYYLLVPYSTRWWQRAFAAAVTALAIVSVPLLWRTRHRVPVCMLAAATVGMDFIYLVIQSDVRYVYPSLWINSLLATCVFLHWLRPNPVPNDGPGR